MSLLFSALSIGIIIAGLAFIIALLPTTPLIPAEFLNSFASLINYIEPWGYLVNFSALLQVAVFITIFEFIVLSFRIVIWVFGVIFSVKSKT